MSAFLVSEKHVLTVANEYVKQYFYGNTGRHTNIEDLNTILEVAKILWSANVKSVNYLYGRKNRRPKINITNLDLAAKYSATEILKLVHCSEYQSCEYDEWDFSPARKLLHTLAEYLVANGAQRDGKAYDRAAWEI